MLVTNFVQYYIANVTYWKRNSNPIKTDMNIVINIKIAIVNIFILLPIHHVTRLFVYCQSVIKRYVYSSIEFMSCLRSMRADYI